MIIRTEQLKEICAKVMTAVDESAVGVVTTLLGLNTSGDKLSMSVTNREYFVEVSTSLGEAVSDMSATVSSKLFLKLISQTTSDTVELFVDDKSLTVIGNGTYKIPLVYEDKDMQSIPRIEINNISTEMKISGDILNSILHYNTKETQKMVASRPVQKMYYVDENGCITFSTGACVNNFSLEKPIKALFSVKLVKLFKLLKGDEIDFAIGYDEITSDIVQTKVRFACDGITITAVLSCDDTLINSVPVAAIRKRADNAHKNTVVLNKEEVSETLNRLLIFANATNGATKYYSTLVFENDFVTVYDSGKKNKEIVYYADEESHVSEKYEAILDITDIKSILDTCNDSKVTISFGDGQAFVLSHNSVKNVVPEVHRNAN